MLDARIGDRRGTRGGDGLNDGLRGPPWRQGAVAKTVMNCKTCDYPLWNLENRICPECGAEFKVRDFEFAINGVRFCCPGCKQCYFGTSLQGHLVPDEFDCVTCNRHLRMDEMILLPAQGVAEHQTRGDAMPWLERGRTGRWSAFFSTFARSLSMPDKLIALVPAERSALEAFRYGWLVLCLFALINFSFVFWDFGKLGLGGMGAGGKVLNLVIAIVASCATAAVILILQTLTAHAILSIRSTGRSLGRTMHCLGYSTPAAVWCAIPCLGTLLSPLLLLWWYINSAKMLRTVYGASRAICVIAVITLPLLVVAGWVAIMVLKAGPASRFTITPTSISVKNIPTVMVVTSPGGSAVAVAGLSGVTGVSEASNIGEALKTWSQKHGEFPAHAALLTIDSNLTFPNFCPLSDAANAKLGTVNYNDLTSARPDAAEREVRKVAALMPANLIAHRAGDFVFVYHGIKPVVDAVPGGAPVEGAVPDTARLVTEELWAAILAPLDFEREPSVVVITSGGGVIVYKGEADFGQQLAEQNKVRAGFGLAPLPDSVLSTVDYLTAPK